MRRKSTIDLPFSFCMILAPLVSKTIFLGSSNTCKRNSLCGFLKICLFFLLMNLSEMCNQKAFLLLHLTVQICYDVVDQLNVKPIGVP
jgi:hypothetical protein